MFNDQNDINEFFNSQPKNFKQIRSEIYDFYLCMLNIVTAKQYYNPNNKNWSWVDTK